MRVLVIEDEPRIVGIVARGLSAEGFAVDSVGSIHQALEYAEIYPYDLIILDLILPDGLGTDFLRRLRATRAQVPVLVLTARGGIESKIETFAAGADDYLTKPFLGGVDEFDQA